MPGRHLSRDWAAPGCSKAVCFPCMGRASARMFGKAVLFVFGAQRPQQHKDPRFWFYGPQGDSRKLGLWDPCFYVVFWAPSSG